MKLRTLASIAATLLAATSTCVQAQIRIGVIVAATGPAASVGIPEKKTVELMPRQLGAEKVEFIVLDDASDTNQAVKAARKLITDEKVDVVVGPSTSAASLAVLDVAAELKTPFISMASSSRITSPVEQERRWAFKTVMDESLMVDATLHDIASSKLVL